VIVDDLIASALPLTTPLVLAAVGGLINRTGGIVNIGLEGQMLLGALAAALASGYAANALPPAVAAAGWLPGVAAGALAGAVAGGLMSTVITRLRGNEIIVGLGFNIVIAGLIGYVLRTVLGGSGSLQVAGLVPLPKIDLPPVSGIPVLGAVVSGKDPLFWFAILLVPLTAVALRYTRWGLRLRATGAAEDSARSLGLPTSRIKDASGVVAGLLAGIAGAHLSLGQLGSFNEDMTAGRGYIALAAFYFGRTRPWPTAAACLIFGCFDAAQIRLQTQDVPAQLVQTIPYAVVVAVLAVTGVRAARTRTRRGV
jgi:general nucleoside transport system permease protein